MKRAKSLLPLFTIILLLGLGLAPRIFSAYAFPGESTQVRPQSQGYSVYLPAVQMRPPLGTPGMFVSWGDTKSGTSTLSALSKQVKVVNPAFTFYNGDLESGGFTTSGANTWMKAVNGSSDNGMSDMTFTVRGNHDTNNTSGWQAYFNNAGIASKVGATRFETLSQNLTYAFDYGNAYFIAVDIPGDTVLITPSELAFLDQGLSGAEARGLTHAFIFFHGPIYPVSSHTSCATRTCPIDSPTASLISVLNKHSIVSAVFNGHEHVQAYVHLDSSRIPEITHPFEQFITGSAGADLYPCNKTYRFDDCVSYPGFAAITISGKSFTVTVYQQGSITPVKTYTFTK